MYHQGAEFYGSDKIFLLVASHLSKRHDVKVFLPADGPLVKRLKSNGVVDIEYMDLSVLRRSDIRGFWGGAIFLLGFLKSVLHCLKSIRKERPDFVYVNTLALLSPLFAALFFGGARRIHHVHEIQDSPRFLFRILYTFSCVLSHQVWAVSGAVEKKIQEMTYLGGRKIVVLHNGIPTERVDELYLDDFERDVRSAFSNPSAPLIAYVARVHFWKGQFEFLRVVGLLKERYGRDVNVAFFGDVFPGYEYLTEKIQLQIASLGIERNVSFFGYREDADYLFRVSDLSVMGSTQPDPFPTIVLESMSQACPVFAYRRGGVSEMIENGISGILVDDEDQMAYEINLALGEEGVLRSMGRNAKERYQRNFSIEAYEKKLDACIG